MYLCLTNFEKFMRGLLKTSITRNGYCLATENYFKSVTTISIVTCLINEIKDFT